MRPHTPRNDFFDDMNMFEEHARTIQFFKNVNRVAYRRRSRSPAKSYCEWPVKTYLILFLKLGLNCDSLIKGAVAATLYNVTSVVCVIFDKAVMEQAIKKTTENLLQTAQIFNEKKRRDPLNFTKSFCVAVLLVLFLFFLI